jgi:cation diffusion facilitator family transporter
MQADALESLLDVFASVLGLLGVLMAAKPPDGDHPYGHGKFEPLAAIGISVLIFIGCYEIVVGSLKRFGDGMVPDATPTSFMIMFFTLLIDGWMSRWEGQMGDAFHSDVLIADSLHTKGDAYATIAVIVSLFASRFGYPIMDPIVALAIAVMIGSSGVKILINSAKALTDSSQINPQEIEAIAMSVPGVAACHAVRTHGSKTRVYMDLHVHVAPEMTIASAHKLAHKVEASVMTQFKEVAEVVVHVEPHQQDLEND